VIHEQQENNVHKQPCFKHIKSIKRWVETTFVVHNMNCYHSGHPVIYCFAHHINNVLTIAFYQTAQRKEEKIMASSIVQSPINSYILKGSIGRKMHFFNITKRNVDWMIKKTKFCSAQNDSSNESYSSFQPFLLRILTFV
jgi:hypothetical protein